MEDEAHQPNQPDCLAYTKVKHEAKARHLTGTSRSANRTPVGFFTVWMEGLVRWLADLLRNTFANLWPDTLSVEEPLRDLGFAPSVDFRELVFKILIAHRDRLVG